MEDTDPDNVWIHNFQSICQLMQSPFTINQHAFMAEADIIRRLRRVKTTVTIQGVELTVRIAIGNGEGAPSDAYLVVIDPAEADADAIPDPDASSYDTWLWVSSEPKGVRWIPAGVRYCSLSAGSAVTEQRSELYHWSKSSRFYNHLINPNYEFVIAVIEGVLDAVAFMPTAAWTVMTDQGVGIETITSRVPDFITPFMCEDDDFEKFMTRLIESTSPTGPWLVHPTTGVELTGWRPSSVDHVEALPRGRIAAAINSARAMLDLLRKIHGTGTAFRVHFNPVTPLIRDFDLEVEDGLVLRCEFKNGALREYLMSHFLQPGRQWDFVIANTGSGLFCVGRDEAAEYTGEEELPLAFIQAHMFDGVEHMLQYVKRHANAARTQRELALQELEPDNVCTRDLWLMNPEEEGDPLDGRKDRRLLLPWVLHELIASCVAMRYGVPLTLGRGDESGSHIVVHYYWSEEDLEVFHSSGRLPFDLWNVSKKVPNARCVVLRFLDLKTENNRNPMCEPFSIQRRDWKKPTSGPGRYFFVLGSIMNDRTQRTGSARGSRYILLPSQFTALSAAEDTLKMPSLQRKAKGAHYARREAASKIELQKPKWGGQAQTVSFANKAVAVINRGLDVRAQRYVLGLGDHSIMAAIKDLLDDPEGDMSINNPLFPSGNRKFARAPYHRSVRDVLQAKWDYGHKRHPTKRKDQGDDSPVEEGSGQGADNPEEGERDQGADNPEEESDGLREQQSTRAEGKMDGHKGGQKHVRSPMREWLATKDEKMDGHKGVRSPMRELQATRDEGKNAVGQRHLRSSTRRSGMPLVVDYDVEMIE